MTTHTATSCDTHTWTPDRDHHACTTCNATCPACNVCEGPTGSALLACQHCLDREAQVLTDIESALDHYQPPSPSPVPAIRYDRDRRGGNVDHTLLDTRDQPHDITATLWSWVATWTEKSGDTQNLDAPDYLRGHLLWAAHNADAAGWDAYRTEMRRLRHRARALAGLLPQRQAGGCIYCGQTVVRDWADEKWRPRPDGLSDELRCLGCRIEWESREHWRYANRHTILALPSTHPDALVTAENSRTIFPEVPAATWRWWRHQDARRAEGQRRYAEYLATGAFGPGPEPERMPVRGWDRRGRALYLLADLTAHVEARADDTRPGRKAS